MRPTSKPTRKLAVNRTTVRTLQEAELRDAAGGILVFPILSVDGKLVCGPTLPYCGPSIIIIGDGLK